MTKANLQKKLICRVLLPMVIGMIAMLLISYLPFSITFPSWIDKITSDMISDRKGTLKTLAYYLSIAAGSALNYPIDFLQLESQLFNNYFNGKIPIKPGFNCSNNSINAYNFQEQIPPLPPGLNKTIDKSFETSMWYLGTDYNISDLPQDSNSQIYISSVFDFFIRPIVRLGSPANTEPFFQRSLTGYESNGFVYANPTEYQSYYVTYNYTNPCSYETGNNSHVYDPRCRPWYQQAKNNTNKQAVSFIDPYKFADGITFGTTFTIANYFPNSSIRFASCLDFGISLLSSYINVTDQGKTTYAFAVSSGDETIVHPNFDGNCSSTADQPDCLSNITSFEMEGGSSSEIAYFNKDILPLFSLNTESTGKYALKGNEIIIVVYPINLSVAPNDSQKVASLGLRIEEKTMTDPFDNLKTELNQTLYIEGVALFIFMCIILVFCWFLTRYVTQQIIQPIDKLIDILDRMKDGDVDINIEDHYQLCSKELTQLYTVFTKLKIVLKFGKSSYFAEDSEAVMNYAQALSLFLEFRNLEGAGICYNNLGVIHYKNFRYHEAVECFAKALEAAESLQNQPELVIRRKQMLAIALLAWKQGAKKIPGLLLELIDIYKHREDPTQAIECLILASEHCIKSTAGTQGYLEQAEVLLNGNSRLKVPKEILQVKILYCKGLLLCKKGLIREGCQKFIDCLTLHPVYDPETRKKCLDEINKIYQKYSVSIDFIKIAQEHCEEQLKDVVFLVDYSMSMNGSRIKKTLLNVSKVIETYLKPSDRVAYVTFNKTCNIVFNLTPRGADCSFLQEEVAKWDSPKGGTAFYDAISLALQEFSAYQAPEENIVPFDTRNSKKEARVKWILTLIDGEDNASSTSFRLIKKKLMKSDVNLVVIGLALSREFASQVQELCESTRKGLFIDTRLLSDLDYSFQTMSILISSKVENIESLD